MVNLPFKLQTQPVTFALMETMEPIRLSCGRITSAHAFPSLFLWKEGMGLSVYLRKDLCAVRCRQRGDNTWFFPCGKPQAVRAFLEQGLTEPRFELCYLREEDCAFLEQEFPGRFQVRERAGDSEYLYSPARQLELSGTGHKKVRQAIARLEREHSPSFELLTKQNLSEAVTVTRAWKQHASGEFGTVEHGQSERFFSYMEAFGGTGVLVRLDGEAVSVMAGCPIGDQMFDGVVNKQSVRTTGLFEYTWRSFFSVIPKQYALVDMEEDLGITGLRLMKRRLQPECLIRMFEAVSAGAAAPVLSAAP